MEFLESILMPWLKGKLMVSSNRISYKDPNTILGLIPLGIHEETIPIRSVASLTTNVKFRLGAAIIGLILSVLGLSILGDSPIGGIILLLIGLSNLANCMQSSLLIRNHGGGVSMVTACIFDKAKLQQFAAVANQHIFADLDATRHQEAMGFHQRSEFLQAQMLEQQIMSNRSQMPVQDPNPYQGYPVQGAAPQQQIPGAPQNFQNPSPTQESQPWQQTPPPSA